MKKWTNQGPCIQMGSDPPPLISVVTLPKTWRDHHARKSTHLTQKSQTGLFFSQWPCCKIYIYISLITVRNNKKSLLFTISISPSPQEERNKQTLQIEAGGKKIQLEASARNRSISGKENSWLCPEQSITCTLDCWYYWVKRVLTDGCVIISYSWIISEMPTIIISAAFVWQQNWALFCLHGTEGNPSTWFQVLTLII